MNETELTDAIIRSALELQRLSQHEEARAEAILRELETELRQLLNSRTLSEASKRDIEAILADAKNAISGKYTNIAGILDVEGIVQHVAERTVEAMNNASPGLAFGPPSVETIRSLSRDILIEGSPASKWWARQAEDATFKFAGIVRKGALNGETNEQIVRKVVGDNGLVGTSRRNARALVHSSIMTAANRARLETFRKNAKFADGVRWLATLDSHTCAQCAALDGQAWDFDGNPIEGSKLDFQMPPAHWACRCIATLVPGRSALDEVFPGLADKFAAMRDRASANGPVKVGMSDWLKRNPAAAEEILGKKRVGLFLNGKLTLTDLVTKGGREKTLAELNAR